VVPSVLVVLAMCLASMQVAGAQLRLQDAVADASRSLARGEGESVAATRLQFAVSGAQLSVRRQGDLVCADARAPAAPGIGWMSALTVNASGCAVDGGL
jgi:Flp pilus assembly protein TadG